MTALLWPHALHLPLRVWMVAGGLAGLSFACWAGVLWVGMEMLEGSR